MKSNNASKSETKHSLHQAIENHFDLKESELQGKVKLASVLDIDNKDDEGMTPLHLATDLNLKDIVESLIARGARINEQDNKGNTPLHYAAIESNPTMVTLLVQAGARRDISNKDGKLPIDLSKDVSNDPIKELEVEHIPGCCSCSTSCIIALTKSMEYCNPIINHPELINQFNSHYGALLTNRLINFGMQFSYKQEDRDILESICIDDHNIEYLTTLIGLESL